MIKILINTEYYVIEVGCQQFFYLTKDAMIIEINKYLDNPLRAENNFRNFKESYNSNKVEVRATSIDELTPGGIIYRDESQPMMEKRSTS